MMSTKPICHSLLYHKTEKLGMENSVCRQGTKNQVRELTDRLEQGVKDLFAGEKYAEYLKTMSRFRQYSTRNTMLIYMMPRGHIIPQWGIDLQHLR